MEPVIRNFCEKCSSVHLFQFLSDKFVISRPVLAKMFFHSDRFLMRIFLQNAALVNSKK